MKNLFDPSIVSQIRTRLGELRPQSERQWGRMTAAQMVAHCAVSMQCAVGDIVVAQEALPLRLMGRVIKPMVFRDDDPIRRNSPTSKALVVAGEPDLNQERERLVVLIDRFASSGAAGVTAHPHSFFGKMTPDEWAILTYKHLDHHLRQFGV